MKCKACGSDDVTQSKGQCNECRWVWEQEHKNNITEKPENNTTEKPKMMSNIFDFFDDEHSLLEEFKGYWMAKHQEDPDNWPLAVDRDNGGIWFEQYQLWKDRK